MSTSCAHRLLREAQEVAQDRRLRQLRQRGRRRAAQRRRDQGERRRRPRRSRSARPRARRGRARPGCPARAGAARSSAPGGRHGGASRMHARAYPMAVARASTSRSMSAWVCTSVTHTSAPGRAPGTSRERSCGRRGCRAAASARLTSATVRPVPSKSTTNSLKYGAASAGARTPGMLAEALRGVLAALHDRRRRARASRRGPSSAR